MRNGKQQESDNELVLSFRRLRQAVGLVGLSIPPVLLFGAAVLGRPVEDSISAFYWTPMGDVLVGMLCAVGVFLFNYKGYQPQPGEWPADWLLSRLGGVAMIGVALVPTRFKAADSEGATDCTLVECLFPQAWEAWLYWLHFVSAAVFFGCMALFCLVQFTRSAKGDAPGRMKRWRNRVYRGCGGTILAAMAVLSVYFFLSDETRATLDRWNYVFWFESLAVWAFAAAWLVKGETAGLLRDDPAEVSSR